MSSCLSLKFLFSCFLMKRRDFIINAGGLLVTLPSFARSSNLPYMDQIGIQLYTLRKEISRDLKGTIKAVAESGYKQVEPYGFPSPQSIEMIKEARKCGMKVNSSHFDWNSILHPERKGVTEFKRIVALAKELRTFSFSGSLSSRGRSQELGWI